MERLLRYIGKDIQNIQFEDWLSHKPEALRPVAAKWFSSIKNCGEDVQDIFHDGYPIGCVDHAPFAYVNIFKTHVNVGFFYGAFLDDPHYLLQGNGKRMRHIKLKPEEKYNDHAILTLIRSSYLDLKDRLQYGY